MGLEKYIRTDIASERSAPSDGFTSKEFVKNGFNVRRLSVGESSTGLKPGTYFTLDTGELRELGRDGISLAVSSIAELIRNLIDIHSVRTSSVLTVCLGNRRITSDAIGPFCAEKLIVTRHIRNENNELFNALGGRECAVLTPGVTGDTGIETFDLIKAAVNELAPTALICIDALATRSIERLATTVQLSDAGIAPGSGIGNRRHEISCSTLGVPVISIGVPTVVHSSTLITDALERAGISEIPDSLRTVLETGASYFVTLKDADAVIQSASDLIARAVNLALLGIEEL